MAEESKSVLETIQAGTVWLDKRGVFEARRNMEYMLAHVLGLKRLDLYLQYDRPLGESELAPLRVLLQRRGRREPLQHLLGEVEFGEWRFRSDARGLIPRPETEQLAVMLLAGGPPAAAPRILDAGCGSGVLGLSLAKAWPDSEVVMLDISPDALALAGENAAALAIEPARLRFVRADLLDGVELPDFQLIVANLPYIPSGEISGLDLELGYEPILALDGGDDGLGLLRRFVPQAAARLAAGGRLALEVGCGQGEAVAALARQAGLDDACVRHDHDGIDRFVFATRA